MLKVSIQLKVFVFLAIVLVLIPCLQQGMFLDGINYANVANNLANGQGTIWQLTYSETFLENYTHQLPFMIWCQAIFFYILGDSLLVERIFCLVLMILNSIAIIKVWKLSFPSVESYYGISLIMWITTPIIFWGFTNNVQENMMSLCSLLSIFSILKYYKHEKLFNLILGGFYCFLCFFCKGVQGLFPLVTIPLFYVCVRPKVSLGLIKDQLLFLLPIIICFLMIWIYEPSRVMIEANFADRLKSTFTDINHKTTENRMDLLGSLFLELLVPLILAVGLFIVAFIQNSRPKLTLSRESVFFILIGISASLPLLVTMEQRRFYLITSIPFFILGIASAITTIVTLIKLKKEISRIIHPILNTSIAIALIISLVSYNNSKRDKNLIQNVHAIGSEVQNEIISADADIMHQYSFTAYLARYYNISLDFKNKGRYNYHISKSSTESVSGMANDIRYKLQKIE